MKFRDHSPISIENFGGLFDRGDSSTIPFDHFQDCENIKFIDNGSFGSRDGIGISQNVSTPLGNVKRIYNYPTPNGNTLIVLITEIRNNLSESISPYNNFDDDDNLLSNIIGPSGIGIISDPPLARGLSGRPGILPGGIYNEESYETQWFSSGEIRNNEEIEYGKIYHVVDANTVYGPLLTIENMTDFAFLPYAGRGYISPFTSFTVGSLNVEKGLYNEFLYVYDGNGTAARRAAGVSLAGTMTIANGAAGHTDAGLKLFGFVAETISGYLTPPGAIGQFTATAASSISFGSVPASGSPIIARRHLVATKTITNFNGDTSGYQFFFVPNATIENDTDTFLNNISFYDADLLDDASHLIDNYSLIPAGAVLTLYHNRLCLAATYDDISLALVSAPGEPEAIDQITGLLVVPLDGNPITNMQELRDILYVDKRARTTSFVDNGDDPSSWVFVVVDNALGTSIHGIATVLDSGSASVDYLIKATYQGISLFNGQYVVPELTWKIDNYWKNLDRNEFRKIQIINAPIQKELYIVLPNRKMLVGNYANGLDSKSIRWAIWSFLPGVNTVAVVNIDEIIIGADLING